MKKTLLKAIIDGLAQNILLFVSEAVIVSVYTAGLSVQQLLLVEMLLGIFSATVCLAFLQNINNSKTIFYFSAWSVICFVLCAVMTFIIQLILKFNWLPLRETNAADGIFLFIAIGCFIVVSIVLRASVIIIKIAKTAQNSRGKI